MVGTRVAMIGDVHGHFGELRDALVSLGADPLTLRLPDDLTVIQVGDLVHKGPGSWEVVRMVDQYRREQPDQWVQLVGNHEAHYVNEKLFSWQGEVDEDTESILRAWWESGWMRTSAAVTRDVGDEILVTHAGLTHSFWRLVLDAPTSAVDAAARLEALRDSDMPWLWMPGAMLTGEVDKFAGPVWAEAGAEVYDDWFQAERAQGAQAPFHQVHGHSTPYAWRFGKWYAPLALQPHIRRNMRTHQTAITVAGKTIIGIDPGHGKSPVPEWSPLVVQGTVHVPEGQDTVVSSWLTAS